MLLFLKENYDILTNFLQIQVFQHDTILKNMLLFFQENYDIFTDFFGKYRFSNMILFY